MSPGLLSANAASSNAGSTLPRVMAGSRPLLRAADKSSDDPAARVPKSAPATSFALASVAAASAPSLLRFAGSKSRCETSISSGTEYFARSIRYSSRARTRLRSAARSNSAPASLSIRSIITVASARSASSRNRRAVAGSWSTPCARARSASVLLTSRLLSMVCTRCGLVEKRGALLDRNARHFDVPVGAGEDHAGTADQDVVRDLRGSRLVRTPKP